MDNRSLARAEIQSVECYNVIYSKEYKRRPISYLNKGTVIWARSFYFIRTFSTILFLVGL
jgi:hypothetical protein